MASRTATSGGFLVARRNFTSATKSLRTASPSSSARSSRGTSTRFRRNDGNTLVVCKFLVPNQSVPRPRPVRGDVAWFGRHWDRPFGLVRARMVNSGSFEQTVEMFDWTRTPMPLIDGGGQPGDFVQGRDRASRRRLNRFPRAGASCASGARSERSARSPPSPGARSTTKCGSTLFLSQRVVGEPVRGQPVILLADWTVEEWRGDQTRTDRAPVQRAPVSVCVSSKLPGGVNWPARTLQGVLETSGKRRSNPGGGLTPQLSARPTSTAFRS